MIKREANFTILFRHWLYSKKGTIFKSCAFELKQTQTDFIPWEAIKEHQIDALMAVKHGKKGLLWKLPDDSRNIKPFDLFYLKNERAYIVIKYPNFFCFIDIDKFVKEKESRKIYVSKIRKSLTSDRAREISFKVVKL